MCGGTSGTAGSSHAAAAFGLEPDSGVSRTRLGVDHVKPLTAEDLTRSKMYAEQVERGRFEKQAKDLRDFLAGLRLEVIFAPVTPETLPRVAQLTQRTNQMNTTLERYTESELQKTLDQGTEAFTVTVNDRFGSYGLVGAVLFTEQTGFIRLTNFLLQLPCAGPRRGASRFAPPC